MEGIVRDRCPLCGGKIVVLNGHAEFFRIRFCLFYAEITVNGDRRHVGAESERVFRADITPVFFAVIRRGIFSEIRFAVVYHARFRNDPFFDRGSVNEPRFRTGCGDTA